MSALRIRRLGYALGAEATGIDLRMPLAAAEVAAIRRAWLDHAVLCFPGQDLDAAQMVRFCGNFGEPAEEPQPARRHGHAAIMMVVNKPVTVNGKEYAGHVADEWHTDQAFTVRPTSATFLNAQELPPVGGDTMFAGLAAAYDALSPGLQRTIASLEGIFDAMISDYYLRKGDEERRSASARYPPVVHPVVWDHPETGRTTLYLDCRLRTFVGMTEEESRPLIGFLMTHATRYEFVYRHRWSRHDLVMWDNRCTLHYAIPDYEPGATRRLNRCALVGEEAGRLYVAP